jgi:hypothetical protein
MSALEHQVPLSQRKPYKRQDAKVRYAAAKQGFAVRRTRRNDQSAVWLLRVREWDPARGWQAVQDAEAAPNAWLGPFRGLDEVLIFVTRGTEGTAPKRAQRRGHV